MGMIESLVAKKDGVAEEAVIRTTAPDLYRVGSGNGVEREQAETVVVSESQEQI